jgi:hypothetical protein
MSSFNEFLQTMKEQMPKLNTHPLDHALRLPMPPGITLELGVYRGNTITRIANAMKHDTIYGFDSFEGLPESWQRPDMAFDKGAFSLQSRLPPVPKNVELIKGWFDQTLPAFAKEHEQRQSKIKLLHIDCDIYTSTKRAFDTLGYMFQPDMIIVFDELLNYPTYEQHEIKAFYEFLQQSKLYTVEWIGKQGEVDLHPQKDNGYFDQPVACRLKAV